MTIVVALIAYTLGAVSTLVVVALGQAAKRGDQLLGIDDSQDPTPQGNVTALGAHRDRRVDG